MGASIPSIMKINPISRNFFDERVMRLLVAWNPVGDKNDRAFDAAAEFSYCRHLFRSKGNAMLSQYAVDIGVGRSGSRGFQFSDELTHLLFNAVVVTDDACYRRTARPVVSLLVGIREEVHRCMLCVCGI